ncbi:cytochrome P450 [Chytridium lagenaria]|nr:cytochrome P450 [Chytridium lagenaria]
MRKKRLQHKPLQASSPSTVPRISARNRILVAALSDPRASKSLAAAFQRRLKTETFPELNEAVTTKGEPLDLAPVFEELAADAVTLWITGTDEEDKVVVETLVDARRTLADLKFIVPTGITWWCDRLRDTLPLVEFLIFLPGAAYYHKRRVAKKKAVDIMREAFLAAKNKREAGLLSSGSRRMSTGAPKPEEPFLHRLIDASEADDEPFTWDEIMQNLEAIQFCAEIPFFSILPNLLYLLSHDRTTQKQIQTELSRLPRSTTDPLRIEDLRTLPTLDLAIRETLRLLPPQPLTFNRSATQNVYKLPGLWALPARNHIIVDLISLHRHPRCFGDDAHLFKPDRFKGFDPTAVKDTKAMGFAAGYMPFGAGPFGCPGQKVALDAVKIVAAEVLRRYELGASVLPSGTERAEDLRAFGCEQGGPLKHLAGAPVLVRKRKVGSG